MLKFACLDAIGWSSCLRSHYTRGRRREGLHGHRARRYPALDRKYWIRLKWCALTNRGAGLPCQEKAWLDG